MFVFTKIYRTYGSFLIWKYFNKCSVFIHFIFITHTTNKLLFHTFRRRCYVCSFFDCKYVGSNKNEGKDWNNRFIYFILFLWFNPPTSHQTIRIVHSGIFSAITVPAVQSRNTSGAMPSFIVYFSSLCFLILVMFVRLVTIWGLITPRKTF